MSFTPSPYKVSTITATGGVNTIINLEILYTHVNIVDFDSKDDGFVYIEFGKKKNESISRGYHKKLAVTRRKKVASKRFDNQATMILRKGDTYTNIKVFKNGNIQMTGLKSIEKGSEAIDMVIAEIARIHRDNDELVVDNIAEMRNVSNKVRLINSDFRVGFDIKRDKLHKIVRESGVFCTYEPCIYPGVKIEYYWNSDKIRQDGVCSCSNALECNGKGCGCGDMQCKKITIAVFQSGCIIITGAQTYEQIDSAYKYICDILETNFEEVNKKQLAPLPVVTNASKKKVLLRKSNIKSVLDSLAVA